MKKIMKLAILLALGCSVKAGAYMSTDYYQAGVNTYVCASTTTAPGLEAAGLVVNPTSALILQNPLNSGVKLVVLSQNFNFGASPAAASGLFDAYNLIPSTGIASTTAGTVTTSFVGLSTGTLTNSKANCYVAGTLPAIPVFFNALGGTSGASAIGGVELFTPSYPPGSIVLGPGAILTVLPSTAATYFGSITWIEVPL